MKYTVVLAQSVPNDVRPQLRDQLTGKFGLSADQADKLAGRKPGRLLKPTSKSRAEALLALYDTLGLSVKLEEVAEDVSSTSEVSPSPVVPTTIVVSPISAAPPPESAPAVAAPLAPPLADSAVPAAGPVPLPGPAPLQGAPVSAVGGGVAVLAAQSAPAFTVPGDLPGDRPVADVAPSAAPTVERTFADEGVPASAEESSVRRISLRQRVLLTTLAPVIVTGLVATIGSLLSVPQAQRQVIRDGAQALAASVGTSVNINEEDSLDAQLKALVEQQGVGFVAVKTPAGDQFFQSKNEEAATFLGEKINDWTAKHPGASSFVDRDRPADRYRAQLEQLKASGLSTDSDQKKLQEKIDAPESRRTTVTNYEVQQVAVYRVLDAKGLVRKAAASINDPRFVGQQPLYTVAVGAVSNKAVQATTRTVLTQLLLTLLATAAAAYFAIRTGGAIVRPIEQLVQVADKISLGQLGTPVEAARNDEIGDLARALERMRLSLEAAMERLRRRRNRA